MPKRHQSPQDGDMSVILKKLKKLERKIRNKSPHRRRHRHLARRISSSSSSEDVSEKENENPALATLDSQDWLSGTESGAQDIPAQDIITHNSNADATSKNESNSPVTASQDDSNAVIELDNEALLILGDDPIAVIKHGPEIRKELASRLQHAATEGIGKDNRKELISKYLTPANCLHINAPKLNPEIKAAIPEAIAKRDKGIETKQAQVASAIACLTEIINSNLNDKDRNNIMLQKLIDATRILCDIQHADSITRRNFILFALKKDIKDHLTNTKINSLLFGEDLAETIKSAKAVTKSGVELKADLVKAPAKKTVQSPVPTTSRNQPLNRKAAAPFRRPQGAAQQRNRESAAPRAPPFQPAHSSRMSSRPQPYQPQSQRNRRY